MRLNKQVPINTIQEQIKIHLKIQLEPQITRERMVVVQVCKDKFNTNQVALEVKIHFVDNCIKILI